MKILKPIFCAEQLQRGGIYQIDGCLYEYLYPDPYARSDHPRYEFRCLQGQRKKADVVLNKNTIRKAYLVPGYQAQRGSTVQGEAIQQSLF
ncbi:hypothetical protein SD81_028230 [Tolypothrix campylonemoides VB511288]|nr:hypothetical protein SD81_028230 [Tolypothrix campylonemoides VB511288]